MRRMMPNKMAQSEVLRLSLLRRRAVVTCASGMRMGLRASFSSGRAVVESFSAGFSVSIRSSRSSLCWSVSPRFFFCFFHALCFNIKRIGLV